MADGVDGGRTYVFGRFRLDPNQRTLIYEDNIVVLRPTVFDVLLYMVEHPLRVVGKDELLGSVWAGRTVEESNLSQAVFWLRSALQQCGGEDANRLIITVRGRGYRFTVEPRSEPAFIFEGDPRDSLDRLAHDASQAPGRTSDVTLGRRLGWRSATAAVLGVLVLTGVGGYGLWRWAHPLGPGNTVVLTDFSNQTHDPVFDRSLATVLRIDLGQSPYVNVMAEKQARETLALMNRPKDTLLTAALAQEVCLRDNANAVLDGGVAAFGSRYVLTLIATDCSGQRTLAAEKSDVANRESVVPALDRLIADVRGKLGEPVASVDRFNVPLAAERTGSLDALKAYSEGVWMVNHGRRPEAIQLEQRAIQLDPDFGMAYAVLGATYYNTYDYKDAQFNITKAFQLRQGANERSQMRVSVLYDVAVTKDFNAERKDLTEGLALYPRDDVNWANFANLEAYGGHFEPAIDYAKRSLALNPRFELPYSILARADLGAGRPQDGLKACRLAVERGVAGEATHREMMRIAWATGDRAAFDREVAWANQNQPAFSMMYVEGEVALSQGKLHDGVSIFEAAQAVSKAQGVSPEGVAYQAKLLVEMGRPDLARARLSHADDPLDPDYMFTIAEIGDPVQASGGVAKSLQDYPSDTLLNNVYAPQVRAALALRSGHAAEAIADLQPALPFRARSPEVDYQLGSAYLAAKDGVHAAQNFNMILAHPGWYPETPLYVLANLGLGRALVLQRDIPGARRAYQSFLAKWKDADPDVPVLKAAKAEYAHLV